MLFRSRPCRQSHQVLHVAERFPFGFFGGIGKHLKITPAIDQDFDLGTLYCLGRFVQTEWITFFCVAKQFSFADFLKFAKQNQDHCWHKLRMCLTTLVLFRFGLRRPSRSRCRVDERFPLAQFVEFANMSASRLT